MVCEGSVSGKRKSEATALSKLSTSASVCGEQATAEGLNDKYLRLSAEFENFRKRSAQEKTIALNKSKARVIEVPSIFLQPSNSFTIKTD